MRSLLVTGASGFVGRHLVERARSNFKVWATGRGANPNWLPRGVEWVDIDLTQLVAVDALPRDWWGVVHLAAETLPASFATNRPLFDSLAMLLNLADHLSSGRLLYVSSCHVYAADSELRTETSQTRPEGRYGLSKLLCETAARTMRHLDVRIARPFNHLGTGMRADLVVPSIVRKIMTAPGTGPIDMLGQDSFRDFLDVADIVDAYLAILELDSPEQRVFNVCSGVAVSIGTLVEAFARAAGKTNHPVFSTKSMSRDDVSSLVGDPTILRTLTGWRPAIDLETSARRIIDAYAV